jgi:cytochrome c
MRLLLLSTAVLAAVVAAVASAAPRAGDATRGAAVYERCEGCHSLDANRVGPMHRGVFGRQAGSVPGYAYSKALRDSGIVWDEAALDAWLSGPRKLVPGVRMTFALSDPQDRADVIAFLRQQSAP